MRTDVMMAYMIIAGLIGFVIDKGMYWLNQSS